MTTAVTPTRAYLAVPSRRSLVRDAVLVLSATALIVVSAQLIIPLPFTPVPITLATFTVMLSGAALGPLRGSLSAVLYLLIGALGAPVFSNGQSGVLLPTFGYIIGYVVAALVAGHLARNRADRHVGTALGLGTLGTLALYAFGVPWLALSLDISLGEAVVLGMLPFLIGDALKIVVLGILLPSGWRVTRRTGE
ncbi:MAG TPA: biotin transporter BioY [Microbacterium sp.]|nr:biotin transporter BioY [Microbacterium sp.]